MIRDAIVEQFNLRIYEESIPRIFRVLDMLSNEQVWQRMNDNSNSVGVLVLHLCGNLRQWIGSGIGNYPDQRDREAEFSAVQNYSKDELKNHLVSLRAISDKAFISLENNNLLEPRVVQGFSETNLSIVIHVIEHFSYHTGQIAYIAKSILNRDLGFYAGMDLNVRGD